MNATRFPSHYKRDFLRFLPRHRLGRVRQISHAYNSIVTSGRLPKLKLESLNIEAELSSYHSEFIEEPYERIPFDSYKPRYVIWNDELGMCKLKSASKSLIGQRLFADLPADRGPVEFEVHLEDTLPIYLLVDNVLTADGAFSLVCLLWHIRDGLVETLNLRGIGQVTWNPQLLASLSALARRPYRLQVKVLADPMDDDLFESIEISTGLARTALQFAEITTIDSSMNCGGQLGDALRFVHTFRNDCREFRFLLYYKRAGITAGFIDALVKSFQRDIDLTDYGSPLEVSFSHFCLWWNHEDSWPETCPDVDAIKREVTEHEHRKSHRLTFEHVNEPTGRKFSVTFHFNSRSASEDSGEGLSVTKDSADGHEEEDEEDDGMGESGEETILRDSFSYITITV